MLLSCESFAAVVSDNDGAAFVTKQEFEDLKASFEEQIDRYNKSLDNKIDGAIADYLDGINVELWEKKKLDPRSQYLFPLVMCGPNNEWNDPTLYDATKSKNYLDFQITFFNLWSHSTKVSRNWGGDSTGGQWQLNNAYTSMPAALPTYSHDDNNKIVRVSKVLETFDYNGRVGTMNTLKTTTEKRNISGTDRNVYLLVQRGRGQLRAYIRGHGASQNYDGDAAYEPNYLNGKIYNYPVFIGIGMQNFTSWTSGTNGLSWTTASGTKTTVYPWTRDGVRSYRGMNANIKNLMTSTTPKTIAEALTYINSSSFCRTVDPQKGISNHGDQSGTGTVSYGNPYLVLPEWQHTQGTNTCYYGTANMQAHIAANGGYWSLTPQQGTSAATQKISVIIPQDQSQNQMRVYNFGGRIYSTFSTFIPNDYRIFPEWVATPNTSFAQESTNNFSQLRASVVSYIDSNGKTHYCDEGMYLGTSEKREATIKFKLRFADDSNWGVDVALSKKPFGFAAVDSDRIAFKYTLDNNSTVYNVASGNNARVACNKTMNIEISDIEKDDMLFLKWTPATAGHYVELESFTDYYIRGT